MIRINLALKKQANYIAPKTGTFTPSAKSAALSDLAPLLSRILLPLGLCAVAYFAQDYYTQEKLNEMSQESANIEKEKTKIQEELKRIKGFELVKTELDRNEHILSTKIETIEKLIRGRDFTVKTLVSISQSLPREVWLTEVTSNEQGFVLRGGTTDIGLISDVMSRLGKTIYFKDVTLKNTQNEANGKQAVFELTARHN